MATLIRQFTATIPSGTAMDDPATIPLDIPALVVESIDLEVPHGPAGLMGFYLSLGGQQAIPWDVGEWIVWDGRADSWPISDYSTAGTWAVVGYNLGDYDHDVTVRFHIADPDIAAPPTTPAVVYTPSSASAGIPADLSESDLLAALNSVGAGQSAVTIGAD